MYNIDIDMHRRLKRGEIPNVYTLIHTHMGWRAYAARELSQIFDVAVGSIADGSELADGSATAGVGALGIISKKGRLLDISGLERSLQPQGANLLTGWFRKDLQQVSAEYANADGYFNEIIAQEPFLGREFRIMVGFEALPVSTHLRFFTGIVTSVTPGDRVVINAEEKTSSLFDTFYLNRSGRYANPKNSNDRLPIPYGDLTDGSDGNWICPCIDTVNHVYCFAGSPVLAVAEGNAVSVYKDGVLQTGGYTFNHSNNYEGLGNIATITFTTDQANAVISVRGKGKAAAGVLMENVIDQVVDALTVENSFSAAIFESTLKALTRQKFETQGYKAAGVINADINIWELIQKMMSSFLGSAYLDGSGELCLGIDDGTISDTLFAGIIPGGDAEYTPEPMLLENIINQLPASFAYDYVVGSKFKQHTDDTAHANLRSQGVYDVQRPAEPYPFYWCRDLASVQKIQDIIVQKFAEQIYIINVKDDTLKRIRIDIGDTVVYSTKELRDKNGSPMYNHFWKVLSVIPDFFESAINFRLLNTAYYLTVAHLADGSHVADGSVMAGGDRDLTVIY